ncbi:MAG: PD-(D/E)XK nuclease family protein [Clostridia bacterium]|nr:PD-(D/E)XK nuclease family protein [Clostridia bacterium]
MGNITVWQTRFPGQMPTLKSLVEETVSAREMAHGVRRGRTLVMVPASFTHQVEMELLKVFGGLLNINVVSPQQMVRRVREFAGNGGLEALNERGKCMAISEALIRLGDERRLHFYDRVARQNGFTQKLSEFLSEAASAGYTPEKLTEMSGEAGMLSRSSEAKYTDLSAIWATYDSLISGRFLDENGQWMATCERLKVSRIMEQTDLVIACFDALSRDICLFAAKAAQCARSVQIVLVMDDQASDSHLFLAARQSLLTLIDEAREAGAKVEMRRSEKMQKRTEALSWLERNLFARVRETPMPPLSGISLHHARTTYSEALFVAQTLKSWHDSGIPWEEMAVMPMDASDFSSMLPVTLQTAEIPFYIKREDSAMRHGFSRMVLSSVRAACLGWQQADMLGIIKSGFVGLGEEDAMRLENFVLSRGIHRQKWLKPFAARKESEKAEVQAFEEMRVSLMEPLQALRSVLASRRAGAAKICEAIYAYVMDVGAYDALREREKVLMDQGLAAEQDTNRQIFSTFLDVLDQMVSLIGEKHIRMDDLPRILEAAFKGSPIRLVPPLLHSVTIEAPGLIAGGDYRAVILMGMQERESSPASNLISERERAALASYIRHPFGETEQEKQAARQEMVYDAIALPTEFLVVTSAATGSDGYLMRPSALFLELQAMVEKDHPEQVTGGLGEKIRFPLSPELALEEVALRLREAEDSEGENEEARLRQAGMDDIWMQMLFRLWHDPVWHDRTRRVIGGLTAKNEARPLTERQAHILFQDDVISITRLERFAACPYGHFVDYGLRPMDRDAYAFEADVRGTFYHDVLEQYVSRAMRDVRWPHLPENEVREMLDRILTPIRKEWEEGPLGEDRVSRFMAEEYERNVRAAALSITGDAQMTPFKVLGVETEFGVPDGKHLVLPPLMLQLPDGMQIALRGKIDRLDTLELVDAAGQKYVRVVDYKSSAHDLDSAGMAYGLELQLPLYLQAAVSGIPGAIPAGALYQVVKDPAVEVKTDAPEDILAAKAKKTELNGLVLDTPEIREAMGSHVHIPSRKSTGSTVNMVDAGQMQHYLNQAVDRATALAGEIRKGNIGIRPVTASDRSPCEFCASRAICGLDRRLPGGKVTDVRELIVTESP